MTNGDEIEAKVVKVTDSELEYKRYDNLDGPSYVKSLANVFMVKYENGVKDVFTTPESVMRKDDGEGPVKKMGEHSPLELKRYKGHIVSNLGYVKDDDMKRLLGDDVFNEYLSARKGYEVGNTLSAFGMATGVLGIMAYIGAVTSALDGDGSVAALLYVAGSVAIVAHAIMTPIGYVRRGVAAGQISRIAEGYNIYNKGIVMEMEVSPVLLAGGYGVAPGLGVSLRF